MPTVFSGAVLILPWLLTATVFLLGVFLAWKVGYPAVRILALEQHIKLLDTKLATAVERADAAEAREKRCTERLDAATRSLESAQSDLRKCLDTIHIKQRLETLADALQPTVERT